MSKRVLFIILAIAILTSAVTAFADEKLFWSNFNSDPVKDGPKYYGTFPIAEDQEPVLITRIRTFHWNSGMGAEPGQICAYENVQSVRASGLPRQVHRRRVGSAVHALPDAGAHHGKARPGSR